MDLRMTAGVVLLAGTLLDWETPNARSSSAVSDRRRTHTNLLLSSG